MLCLTVSKAGLANINPQEGHIIRKDSPEGRTFVYIYIERGEIELTVTSLFTNNDICIYFLI
jgi:hypothetical protein